MRVLALLLAGMAVAACSKTTPSAQPSDAECVAYRNKLFSLLPDPERAALAKAGNDKPAPKEIEICRQRMHSDEIACVQKATTLDDALACKSAIDDRTEAVKRTPEECAAYREHMQELAASASTRNGFGPPLTPAMAKMAARECERSMTRKRYDCVMKATISAGLIECPPN